MILALATAALSAAQPASCPIGTTAQASICQAIAASSAGNSAVAAAAFEQAASDSKAPDSDRLWAAAGNMWIVADQPAKAALDLDRALSGTGLDGAQRGEALLDRARAAQAEGDLKTARARTDQAAAAIPTDPFLWYFSAALAIREGDSAKARASIDKALDLAPAEPLILFEAGHVARFAGDDVGARDYWTRTIERDPGGDTGAAARAALKVLGPPLVVQSSPPSAKPR